MSSNQEIAERIAPNHAPEIVIALEEKDREIEAWSDRCRIAEQDLAIAGVRGSPPAFEATIPRLQRELREERTAHAETRRQLDAYAARFHRADCQFRNDARTDCCGTLNLERWWQLERMRGLLRLAWENFSPDEQQQLFSKLDRHAISAALEDR